MVRRSGMPQRLTSLCAFSRPAENATINSVPPAIGVHWPGSAASRSSTAPRLPGATKLVRFRITAHGASAPAPVLLPATIRSAPAAAATDSKMRMNPVQRQRLPASAFANLRLAGMRAALEKLRRGHQHARRADAALRAAIGRNASCKG